MKEETRGRKPIPPKDLRTIEIKVRLNPAEQRAMKKAAGDLSLAVWVRQVAMEAAKRTK